MTMQPQHEGNELGRRLKEARLRANAHQVTLAEWCGLSQDRISKYETGAIVPSAPVLAKLCSSLELPFDDMIRLTL